jgi:hypothetical protein
MFKITQLDECFLAGYVQHPIVQATHAVEGFLFFVQGFVGFRLTFQLQPFCQAKNNNKPPLVWKMGTCN